MDRRSFLHLLLATPLATVVDVEALIWTPTPMIVVPAMPTAAYYSTGQMVAAAWEEYVGSVPVDAIFNTYWLLEQLKEGSDETDCKHYTDGDRATGIVLTDDMGTNGQPGEQAGMGSSWPDRDSSVSRYLQRLRGQLRDE